MDRCLALTAAVAASDRLIRALADDVGVAPVTAIDRALSRGAAAIVNQAAVVIATSADAARVVLAAIAVRFADASAGASELAMRHSYVIHPAASGDLQTTEGTTGHTHAAVAGFRFANAQAPAQAATADLHDVAAALEIAVDRARDVASGIAAGPVDGRTAQPVDLPFTWADLVHANVVGAGITGQAQVAIGYCRTNIARQQRSVFQAFKSQTPCRLFLEPTQHRIPHCTPPVELEQEQSVPPSAFRRGSYYLLAASYTR
jgi:hypothetical protein